MIDRMAPPKTILCTPSDALSITDLASCVYRPERCFAVRGGLAPVAVQMGQALRLVYPAGIDQTLIPVVLDFLKKQGRMAQAEIDADVPMLVKNLVLDTKSPTSIAGSGN